MYVEITEAADFYRQVIPAYNRLRASPDMGDTLEIVLGGGTYDGVNLSLGDGLEARPIDLIVRAADRARPPVLRDLALPNLTQLLTLLTPTQRDEADAYTLSPPHERALAAAAGWRGADGCLPFAAQAAARDGLEVGAHAWGLVTPAHWHVGRDHVTLVDPAALDLSDEESRAAFEAVRGLFETEGFAVAWGAASRWYVAHESLADLACASLDRVIARPVEPWLRPNPGAETQSRLVRRLQSELQMLLYPHPINETREQDGELPMNSFWLSGCGRFQPSATNDPQIADDLRTSLLADDWVAWAQAWRALDADELAGLLAAAQSGEPVSLTLCGERSAQRFDSAPRSTWRRLADRWRTNEPHSVLEAL